MRVRVNDWLVPGQWWQRVAFVVLAPAAAFALRAWWGGALHGLVVLLAGFAAFLTGVLSSAALFRAWTRFGEALNRVVVRVLFAAIYCLVVPLFAWMRLRDRLRVRSAARTESFWIEREPVEESLERMQRMG